MTDRKKFWRWCRELRRKFPSEYPVKIELVPPGNIPGHFGTCTPYDVNGKLSRLVVRIADNLSPEISADTLAEEWAHALRFHLYRLGDPSQHDSIYGGIHVRIKEEWLHKD